MQSLIIEQVRFLTDRFAQEWKKQKHPSIENYLQQIVEGSRETLLRNLLLVEISQRQQANEVAAADEFIARFPQHQSLIQQLFTASLTVDTVARAERIDTSVEMESEGGAATIDFSQPATQLGDYLLLNELGRGGFGVVWEAEHVEQRFRVALKTLPLDPQNHLESFAAADRLHKFRQEFRRLSDVSHPNLVGMQNLECDGQQWFLTMDLVRGKAFDKFVRSTSDLDESKLRQCFSQLVAGVAELHRRGVVVAS